MCGICGIASRRADVETSLVAIRLTDLLAHRGPDGEGFWARDARGGRLLRRDELATQPSDLVLGHRRLSIVDLAGGAQPMSNEDGSLWVSYNGEIYNSPTLRDELRACGHRFATECDTEVLVHGFEEWGVDLFPRLNGIFAFALYDSARRNIVLVRDPLGVKPLYVGTDGPRAWWSSELGAAVRAGIASSPPSVEAAKLFLTFRYVPSPWTMIDRAWKVPPGHYVQLGPDDIGEDPTFVPYRSAARSAAQPRTRDEWAEATMDELEASVARQLMADVPVASMLSGGVDSSLVTLFMARHLPYAPLSYGIGLASDGDRSEAVAARFAADVLGIPHHTTNLSDTDYVGDWPSILSHLGEPIANPSALMVDRICADVGRSHKVVLTGQGADEPLGGYPRHLVERFRRAGLRAPAVARLLVQAAMGRDESQRLMRSLALDDRAARYAALFSVFDARDVDGMIPDGPPTAELARSAVARWIHGFDGSDPLNELLEVDLRMSLADDLLIIADHFSMRSSVELRVPFLDLQLVELLLRMPSRYKISRLGDRKWLYRKAAATRLPPTLAEKLCGHAGVLTRKRGFSTPTNAWFSSDGGLLGDTSAWAAPLTALTDGRGSLAAAAAAQRAGRPRATLFTLASWLAAWQEPVHAQGVAASA